jgi:hypothetical protein
MKKILLPLALLCCTLTSLHAEDRRGDVGRREFPGNRELRACQFTNDLLKRDNQSLSDRLAYCQNDRNDTSRIDQLVRENKDLNDRNQFLIDQVGRLKTDNARLEMEAHPDRGGRFDLAASIMACGKIDNAVYAQQCSSQAKANSIQASVIEQCSKISNAYYALECVKSAGTKEVGARQVEACLLIDNAVYAQQCVQAAGERRVSADVIKSCVKTSTNAYYQLECVKNM